MALSTSYANTALNAIIAAAGSSTVALSSTAPELDELAPAGVSNVTEPSGGSYARQTITAANWSAASARSSVYTVDIVFPVPTADWGTVGWFVIYSGTTAVHFGDLADTVTVVAGSDQVRIPANDLLMTIRP